MITNELAPKYINQKSFYGKARVVTESPRVYTLISYATKVATIDKNTGKITLFLDYYDLSATTTRHLSEFLSQYTYLVFNGKVSIFNTFELDKDAQAPLKFNI